jgi:hypothetical protein
MRVYLPATVPGVAGLLRTGELGPAPVPAHAVTPALRVDEPDADVEELEYLALRYAAAESLELLTAEPAGDRRRVVLAADVPASAVTPRPGVGPAAVTLDVAVPLERVASAHVDERGADPDADPDLLWYAPQELGQLAGT